MKKLYVRKTCAFLAVSASTFAGAGTTGCDDSDVGVVRQNWSINGTRDPQACVNLNAAQMRVVALDAAGVVRSSEFASCAAFQSKLQLEPGTYSIASTFLGPDGQPVSRTLAVDRIPIVEDEETAVNVDFPLTAFAIRP